MNTDCFRGVWITICLQATDTKAKTHQCVINSLNSFIHSLQMEKEREKERIRNFEGKECSTDDT